MQTREEVQKMFASDHLPEKLRQTSKLFENLALTLFEALPGLPERTLALRKLWETKNLAVMAMVLDPRD